MASAGRRPKLLSERQIKWMLNLFPPLLFGRIRVRAVGPGCRSCSVEVVRSLLTRNLNGTTFGGTIFCAVDPFYAVMYWQIFARRGERVRVWLKSGRVEYLRPATTTLRLEFALDEADIAGAVAALDRDGRYTRTHRTEAIDRNGNVCAVVETEVYLGRERGSGPAAF